MKQFIETSNKIYNFSSCEICQANCCNGQKGTLFAQIILEDFKEVYENFPIVFIFGELGYIKPVVLLTNGNSFCKYLKEYKCTIYEKRPSICRVYPLSANIDNKIYIDELCPAVDESFDENNYIVKDNAIHKNFDYKTLHEYQDKYIETFHELDQFNKKEDFSLAIQINGIQFFKFKKDVDNKYMQMHQKSLIHLQDGYFKN